MITLGCLHAHHSNISYIEELLSCYDIDCMHFVDPALMHRLTSDAHFHDEHAQQKVHAQLAWIAAAGVDAILITCTTYIAMLKEMHVSVPIIKIDEPFFERLIHIDGPQTMLFTNPATVEGTMARLAAYAKVHHKVLDIEAVTIADTFDVLMRGDKVAYEVAIRQFLNTYSGARTLSVAQLSMVDAAKAFDATIINPLQTLKAHLIHQLALEVRTG